MNAAEPAVRMRSEAFAARACEVRRSSSAEPLDLGVPVGASY